MPAVPVPFASVPTMVVTCASHTDKLAVVSGVGVADDCIHKDALKPGKTFAGIDMMAPYALLLQPYWLPRGWMVKLHFASALGCASI